MNYHDDLCNHPIEESKSIPRSPSTTDLSTLLHKLRPAPYKSKKRYSISFASTDQSECGASENSQVLYMAGSPKRSRKLRDSLSSINNRSTRIMDGSSDTKAGAEDVSEEITWNIIDREIFEWQYVCRTGRPYWWSPDSRYSRLKKLPPRLTRESPPRSWIHEIDDRPNNYYSSKRRATSDSYLAGQGCVEDLAHLVAIQLLGSCFTLPPDHKGMMLPDYTSYNLNGSQNNPDPHLISSLTMHTHFRYSPCFGHQARNTSPVQLWSGAYDGPFPSSSPPPVGTGFQTPVIGTSGSPPRRRRSQQRLNVTEGSENSCSFDDLLEDCARSSVKDNLDPTVFAVSARTGHCRQGIEDVHARPTTLPDLPSQSHERRRPKTFLDMHKNADAGMAQSYRGVQSSSYLPKTNYSLQPVIRSEPHPVFVQPVRELVVKRWKTFRRRFGGSLHAPLPTGSEDDTSGASTPGQSDVSSPAMSGEGRTRRRRAQERGDIDSASVDSIPHYNSPVSGYLSPNGNGFRSPLWVDSMTPSPAFQLADPLAAAAALALAETQSPNPSTPSNSPQKQYVSSLSSTEIGHQTPEVAGRRVSTSSYTKILQKRQHRRSMLSEMYTPEDFAEDVASSDSPREATERSFLSAAGSRLPNPTEEVESDIDLVIRSGARESVGNLGSVGAFSVRRMTVGGTGPCPRLSRTSTSGTQVFMPSDEGVEIDGLPVGLGKEVWDRKGKRRERTYL